jgi:subtilase family serine protease
MTISNAVSDDLLLGVYVCPSPLISLSTSQTNILREFKMQVAPANSEETVKVVVAVKQQNLDVLEQKLMDVSMPLSPHYGKHLSKKEVHDLVAPKTEDIVNVINWLKQGKKDRQVTMATVNGDFISAEMTVAEAGELLGAQYHQFVHSESGKTAVRLETGYNVPEHLNVDFVAPTTRFPHSKTPAASAISNFMAPTTDDACDYSDATSCNADANCRWCICHAIPSKCQTLEHAKKLPPSVFDCGLTPSKSLRANPQSPNSLFVSPSTLWGLYQTTGIVHDPKAATNKIAFTNFIGQHYSTTDLSTFWSRNGVKATTVVNNPANETLGHGTEAELDAQYITAMGQGIPTIAYSNDGTSSTIVYCPLLYSFFLVTLPLLFIQTRNQETQATRPSLSGFLT